MSGGGRRGAATGRWRERVGEGGGWGGALTRLGPDAAIAAHIAIIKEEAEREREIFDLGERGDDPAPDIWTNGRALF